SGEAIILVVGVAAPVTVATATCTFLGRDLGPPESEVSLGEFLHPSEEAIVCECTTEEDKVPYVNAPVYFK
ncbi:H/ACA ribonucleoprotein complex subunit 1, partial [Galemys pyrenaicus]